MSDTQELKSDAVKAIEVALELAIDECLALEAGIISTLVNSEQRRTDLRRGHDFQPRIDSTLHADAKLTSARDRVQKLGAAISALKAGGWSQVDAPQIKSASCGDHGGALSASRDACPTCQSDASHQEHELPNAFGRTHVFYCGEHGGAPGNSQKYCPACRLPDASVIRATWKLWKPNR